MGFVWAVLAAMAMPVVVQLQPGTPTPPAWAFEAWADDAERLLAPVDLGREEVTLSLAWRQGASDHLDLYGEAERDRVMVTLEGEGWQAESARARRLLRQNLAHEVAHIAQLRRFDSAFEPRLLHEGYAEAQSLELLILARLWSNADARRARLGFEQRCIEKLREGPLLPRMEAGDRQVTYACGAVLWLAAADRAGTSPETLHRSYAEAAAWPWGLGSWARATLGREFTRSAWHFVTMDLSHAPESAIAALRAGQL